MVFGIVTGNVHPHKADTDRSRGFYEVQLCEPKPSILSHEEEEEVEQCYTGRSKIPMYERNKCFFCNKEGIRRNQIYI